MKIMQKTIFALFLSIFLFHSIVAHQHSQSAKIENEENISIFEKIFRTLKGTIQFDLGDQHLEKVSVAQKLTLDICTCYDFKEIVVLVLPFFIISHLSQTEGLQTSPFKKVYTHSISYRGPTF
jgi:hypothetical protein